MDVAWALHKTIVDLRAGAFEDQGVHRDSTVLPVVVCFDNVGESGVFYRWLEEEFRRLGLLCGRPGVRPLTIVEPKAFEGLLALGARGHSVCDLLHEKTSNEKKWGALDRFLFSKVEDSLELRLPEMSRQVDAVIDRTIARLRESRREGTDAQ